MLHICTKCGNEVAENQEFCRICGTDLKRTSHVECEQAQLRRKRKIRFIIAMIAMVAMLIGWSIAWTLLEIKPGLILFALELASMAFVWRLITSNDALGKLFFGRKEN